MAFDSYYLDLSHLTMAERRLRNYDHPDALDSDLFVSHLDSLKSGRDVAVPNYDFATHTLNGSFTPIPAKPVVLVEGILLLAFEQIAARLDLSVFLDAPEPLRLERRIRRDTSERGRDHADVRRQFAATVAPMHDRFVQPNRHRADLIVDSGKDPFGVVGDLLSQRLAARRPAAVATFAG